MACLEAQADDARDASPACGPLKTFTRTFVPSARDLPAAGSVAVTSSFVLPGTMCSTGLQPGVHERLLRLRPCWPLTAGTVTFGGPVETQIVTVPPLSTFAPAPGSCLKTIPFWYFSFGPLFTVGSRFGRRDLLLGSPPAARSRSC